MPLATMPSQREMGIAYQRGDASYDGISFLGVRTTGVFCRPSCPARKPFPQNVEYFASVHDALFAGYRPCLRCRPLEVAGRHPECKDCITVSWIESPAGPLVAGATSEGVCLLEFTDRRMLETQFDTLRARFTRAILPGKHEYLQQLAKELGEYFSGARRRFDVPLAYPGSPFQVRVWGAVLSIPYGETSSYADLAEKIGAPGAHRAVGHANGQNRVAIVIPCHRVVNKNGKLGGYGGGLWRKQLLLDIERGQRCPRRISES